MIKRFRSYHRCRKYIAVYLILETELILFPGIISLLETRNSTRIYIMQHALHNDI